MYAFGMLGNYFSQGVYAVAGPFQGAVDIIVVQQEDGTFKSSPWYVKCGDFQGVLKRKEKIVNILVNGIQANFYMLLNNRGEAYFEKEVENAVLALPSAEGNERMEGSSTSKGVAKDEIPQVQHSATTHSNISSAEGNGKTEDLRTLTSVDKDELSQVQDMTHPDFNASIQCNDANQMRGLPDNLLSTPVSAERNSTSETLSTFKDVAKDEQSQTQDMTNPNADGSIQVNDADPMRGLLDDSVMEGSLPSPSIASGDACDQKAANVSALSTTTSNHSPCLFGVCAREFVESDRDTSSTNTMVSAESHYMIAEDRLGLREAPGPSHLDVDPTVISINGAKLFLSQADSSLLNQVANEERSKLQVPANVGLETLHVGDSPRLIMMDEAPVTESGHPIVLKTNDGAFSKLNTLITEDWFSFPRQSEMDSIEEGTHVQGALENFEGNAMEELIWNDYKIVTAEEEKQLHDALNTTSVIGVPVMVDERDAEQIGTSVWVSDGLVNDATSNAAPEDRTPSSSDASRGRMRDKNVVCKVEEGPPSQENKVVEIPTIPVVPPPSRWTMWPLSLRRSRVEKAPVTEAAVTKQAILAATNIAVGSPLTEEILRKNGYYEWSQKPKLRSYVPTSAQIESLKLKDGPNKVTFTFPRVLGRTQVDANIYLWKWNTRIVISDVDGTITKSDVLGQFMPLVGRDWSQSGVTRLFSAIKENGYEVLFLSARAISQAYLTRQFLINLKQDGETLPEGPVFISPDGLIPSLYREVVRRAPHEFKISCLEGIRSLFPNDANPFYAGFGNRDTDEISYLKVGIPKGKIFIINPKGEVMVNHHVDAKSYTSIHALVDDMFPAIYSSEQEDFNAWNYWKLPLPDIVDELSTNSSKAKKGGNPKR